MEEPLQLPLSNTEELGEFPLLGLNRWDWLKSMVETQSYNNFPYILQAFPHARLSFPHKKKKNEKRTN
jgi:hypothetical protein